MPETNSNFRPEAEVIEPLRSGALSDDEFLPSRSAAGANLTHL